MTPCQQRMFHTISGLVLHGEPSITIINAEPGSGLSTLMLKLNQILGANCLHIKTRPALSGMNLLEAFYYELGLAGESISHRSPIPEFIKPLISLRSITHICIEDIDDFALTMLMKKTTVAQFSRLAMALPTVHFIVSQSLSRNETGCDVIHRDLKAYHERSECYLRSFTGEREYVEYFKKIGCDLGLKKISDSFLEKLYDKTDGNLAFTILYITHPFLRIQWVNNTGIHYEQR